MRPAVIYHRFRCDFLRYLHDRRHSGDLSLPSERELCRRFGVSRTTVRKLFSLFETDGLILRERNGVRIAPVRVQKGRYVFCIHISSMTRNITLGLYRRMLSILQTECRVASLKIETVCYDDMEPPEELLNALRGADVVFTALLSPQIRDILLKSGLPLVFLDSFDRSPEAPGITLENRRIGELAAEYLYGAGCRRPALLNPSEPDYFTPFRERREGFCRIFRKHGIEPETVNPERYGNDLRNFLYKVAEQVAALPEQGKDSLFAITDEHISILLWDLLHSGGRENAQCGMRLVAFDACGESLFFGPSVTRISNGSRETVTEILSWIHRNETGGLCEPLPHITVEPSVLDPEEGNTI